MLNQKYMNNEMWLDISNFEGIYQVSNFGKIRRLLNSRNNPLKIPQNITGYINQRGYREIRFKKNHKWTNHLVHRLVGLAFIPNPENLYTINHIDGNKLNNHVSNLEWMSLVDNIKHAYANHLVPFHPKGIEHPNFKLTLEDVKDVFNLHENGLNFTQIGKIKNVSRVTISSILKRYQHVRSN